MVGSLLDEACQWASSLTLSAIPDDVRRLAVAQALSAAGARAATRRHPVHTQLEASIDGSGWAERAASDALLTMALDFDETAFAGHLGHAAVAVALRAAVEAGAAGERALVAMVAASEVAARLTASVTLGSARGQTAAHTHAVAAVVAAGVALGLGAGATATALARVLETRRAVDLASFMGSDAKFRVAANPILDAGVAIEVAGAKKSADNDAGALDRFLMAAAELPLPEAFSGYGERWHLRTLSIKAVPGCAYLTAPAEAAASIGPLDLDEVIAVHVAASIFTVGMDAESAPFIHGPTSPLPALSFCTAYNVATALGGGGLGVEDLHGSALADPRRWRVAGLVHVEHDPALSLAALAATAPVGAALAWAGERAIPYLLRRGATSELAAAVIAAARAQNPGDLQTNAKRVGARLRVTLRDGRVLEAERDAASGGCQQTVEARVSLASEKLSGQLNAAGVSAAEAQARVQAYEALERLDPPGLAALAAAG